MRLATLVLAVGLTSCARSAPPPQTVPVREAAAKEPDRIGQLLAQLSAESLEERERAERELLALGEEALPALERAAGDRDAERAARAAAIAQALHRALLERSLVVRVEPSKSVLTRGEKLTADLTVTNTGRRPMTLVIRDLHPNRSHGPTLVSWSLHGRADFSVIGFGRGCGCRGFSPITREHFLILAPGESRMIARGSHVVDTATIDPGVYDLIGSYHFKRIDLEPRYFPTAEIDRLWRESLEISRQSDAVEVTIREK